MVHTSDMIVALRDWWNVVDLLSDRGGIWENWTLAVSSLHIWMDLLVRSNTRGVREVAEGVSWETRTTLLLTETLTLAWVWLDTMELFETMDYEGLLRMRRRAVYTLSISSLISLDSIRFPHEWFLFVSNTRHPALQHFESLMR